MTVLIDDNKMAKLHKSTALENEKNKPKKSTNMMEDLKSLSKYFSELIDTIPPKIYFNKDNDILENIEMNKMAIFDDSINLSKKSKNKRIKLDPNAAQKISDIASAYYDKKKSDGKMSELKKKLSKRIKELREARGAVDVPKGRNNKKLKKNDHSDDNNANKEVTDDVDGANDDNLPKIYNKEGNLVFSKFDFASHVEIASQKELEKKKSKKESLKGLLVKAKKEENKISRLEKNDMESAIKLKEKKLWRNALEKCEGNKVRDDPKLIEKQLKQTKKLKVRRAKAWGERKQGVEMRMQKKQDKRQKHIKERSQNKKEKKIKLLKKKGRIVS